MCVISKLGPHLRTPNPGLNRGSPPYLLYKREGEPRVKPGVWRPEMWALFKRDRARKFLHPHAAHSSAIKITQLNNKNFTTGVP
jgi:hypothetical protein